MKSLLQCLKPLLMMAVIAMPLAAAPRLSAQDYWRVIDKERFKHMSMFERAQYEKALQLLNNRQYRAAASEFERFLVQYKESEVLPYIVFFRAYSLHQAKDRFKAISVYNEVLDFYPGEIEAAAPAMYYRGMAQLQNGDYSKGMKTMKQLLDDADYSKHPVAASASLQLIRNYWRNKEPEKAEQCLKQIVNDFRGSQAAEQAKSYFAASCISTGKLRNYINWYLQTFSEDALKKKISPAQFRVNMLESLWNVVFSSYCNNENLLNYRGGKKGTNPRRVIWEFLQENRRHFEKINDLWTYYGKVLRAGPAKIYDKTVNDMFDLAKKEPDGKEHPGRQQQRFRHLVNLLLSEKKWDLASYVNRMISNPLDRDWNEYKVITGKEQWDAALKHLDMMAGKHGKNASAATNIIWEKAFIYRDRKREYDKAIKEFYATDSPPRSLWEIAETHKRKKDHKAVIETYFTIEKSFPDQGPVAAMNRSIYYNQLGKKKKSIAEARRILKVYPKSPQSSWAHQHLESMGIATGGGLTEEDIF